ncbi:MAG: hypothetical protein KUG78_08480 [Kangiellaceae bacterium]|nr:hypothetical protein [Kangiellaceae bacterium]
MNKDLLKLIDKYNDAVKLLFPRVAEHLAVKLPISNTEWTGIGAEQRGETPCGIKYFIHGYGIAMNDGKVKVDFDLGDSGQINGFDAWRLESFVEENNIKTNLSSGKDIEAAIKLAEADGDVIFSGYILYYLNAR